MISTNIRFDQPGKQHGYLQVPHSYNLAGWANLMIPITTISNGEGPTSLVLAGNHGDEYQGQIAILKLAREIDPSTVSGRIILIPSLNFPAAKTAERLSPLDGKNLNRCFPGNSLGSVTERIADYLTQVLFPLSDIVIDIHSGGRSLEFFPCAHMHVVADPVQRKKMLGGMLAWNTDFCLLYTDIAGSGLLPVEAENQGKIVVTTELGGGEAIPAAVHRIAQQGLRNVLTHFGLLRGETQTREALRKPPAVLLQALNQKDYLLAPESGVFEILVDLGVNVSHGQPIGQIHFLERPDRNPELVLSQTDGVLIAFRAPCLTQQGDCVAVIAEPADTTAL